MTTEFEQSITSPVLKAVASHWFAVRGGREMPAFASLMPSALKHQLPIVWSYTYNAGLDSFTGRLAGSLVTAIFGGNFRGLPMAEAHPKDNYPRLYAKCKRVLTQPALYHGSGISMHHPNGITLSTVRIGERIIMPLSDPQSGEWGVFGASDFPPRFSDDAQRINFDTEVEAWFCTVGNRT